MVYDVSGSLNRVDDYQPWPKEGDSANCKAAVDRNGCFDGLIAGQDVGTNTLLRILPTYRDLPNTRLFAQGSVSYFTSTHDIKAGYQIDYAWNEVLYFSSSGMRANYRNGVPEQVNTYNTPARSIPENIQQGLYIQDKWRPGRKLTVNAGLRLDTNYGWTRALCQEATPFVEARCFDKMSGIPDWKDVSPRLSAVYDIAGDGRTALKFAANRYIIPVGSGVLDRVNPVFLASDTRPWTRCAAGQTTRLRSERRSASPNQRAGPLERVQFRQLESLRARLRLAVGARILGRDSAPAALEHGGQRRLHAP